MYPFLPDGAVAEGRSYDLPFLFVRQSHSLCFLTSDIFFRNSLIPLTPGIKKALNRSFRNDVWIQSQTVVCFSFWSGRFFYSKTLCQRKLLFTSSIDLNPGRTDFHKPSSDRTISGEMVGTLEGSYFRLNKLGTKSLQTEFSGRGRFCTKSS